MTRNDSIVQDYINELSPAELSIKYGISDRQIQRIVRAAGQSRTISDSFRIAIKTGRMKYYHKPDHLKVKRKHITHKLRYEVMNKYNFTCVFCGATAKNGVRIEIDHVDENPTNNELSNLQVLCNLCNKGKSDNKELMKNTV